MRPLHFGKVEKLQNAKRKPIRVVRKLFFDSFTTLYLTSENNPMCGVNRYSSPAPPSPRTSSSVLRRFNASDGETWSPRDAILDEQLPRSTPGKPKDYDSR